MKPGAVANVGKDMFFVNERCLADPGCAFSTHLGEGHRIPIHPDHHVVATDSGEGTTAFRDARTGVMRTAATKPRWPLSRTWINLQQGLFFRLNDRKPCLNASANILGQCMLL